MLLSVREIINTPGKKISFQFSMDLSCVEFGGYCPVAEPVVVTGTVRNMAGVLVMQGTAETMLHAFCDRCGKPLVCKKASRLSICWHRSWKMQTKETTRSC